MKIHRFLIDINYDFVIVQIKMHNKYENILYNLIQRSPKKRIFFSTIRIIIQLFDKNHIKLIFIIFVWI